MLFDKSGKRKGDEVNGFVVVVNDDDDDDDGEEVFFWRGRGAMNVSAVHCSFFLRKACKKGSQCPFLHDYSLFQSRSEGQRATPCVFFQKGNCLKGFACPFSHNTTTSASTSSAEAAGQNPLDAAAKIQQGGTWGFGTSNFGKASGTYTFGSSSQQSRSGMQVAQEKHEQKQQGVRRKHKKITWNPKSSSSSLKKPLKSGIAKARAKKPATRREAAEAAAVAAAASVSAKDDEEEDNFDKVLAEFDF